MLISPFIPIIKDPMIKTSGGIERKKLRIIIIAIRISIIPPMSKKQILAFKTRKTKRRRNAPVWTTPPFIEKRAIAASKSIIPRNFTIIC